MTTWRKLAALLAALLLTIGLAACGDDDDAAVAADDSSETTEAEGDGGEGEEGDHEDEMDMEGNPCAADAPDDALPPAEDLDPDATPVTVTAKDYEFVGADALAAGGSFGVTFENEGNEIHEFALSRLAEDEDRPVEEILASGEEPELTEVAFGIACPGASTTFNADVSEPGRYVAVCFVPVGTTAETTEEPSGPPHASQGMFTEFTIE